MLFIYFLVSWGFTIDKFTENFGQRKQKSCSVPTLNNPFMNHLILDESDKKPACDYTKETKKGINSAFNTNLYQDLTDIYDKNNSQRQFYTMPVTTIPNNQKDFAKAEKIQKEMNIIPFTKNEIKEIINYKNSTSKKLFSTEYKFPVLLAFLIAFFNQLSGINAFLYYAPRIFEIAGLKESSALLSSIGIGITNLIFTLLP